MKRSFIFLLIFVVFLLAAAGALLVVPPVGYAKKSLVEGVREATGLDLKINGRMSLRLLPAVHLQIENVVLTNPAVAPDKPIVAARAVEVHTALWPLFRGERRIERVALVNPSIDIEIDKDGRAGWQRAATRSTGQAPAPAAAFSIAAVEATGATVEFRDQRSGLSARLDRAKATVRDITLDHVAEAVVSAAAASATDPSSRTTIEIADLAATLSQFESMTARELNGTGGSLRWRQAQGDAFLDVRDLTVRAQALGLQGTGALTLGGSALDWRDQSGASTFSAREVAATAKSFKSGRLDDVAVKSSAVAISAPTRAPGGSQAAAGLALEQVTLAAPLLATGTPLEAAVSFVWNKERVAGSAKVPAPEILAAGAAVPATVSLTADRGSLEFDGTIATGSAAGLKGRSKASTTSLDNLARWLDLPLPAAAKGPGSLTGDIDAQARRIAITNGRIEHATNALTGNVTIDLGGTRPMVSGKLAADKLAVDQYLGSTPVKRSPPSSTPQTVVVTPDVPVNEALKAYLRAMIEAPVRRGGALEPVEVSLDDLIPAPVRSKKRADAFEWSADKLDFSGMRTVDLDVDWSIKTLSVRGIDVAVPQLKTLLKDGALTLEGRDLATRGGRLTGKAEINARQAVPVVSASLKADGVDLLELTEAFGMSGVIAGQTAVEANVTGTGASQKQLVETLSGTVKTRMGQGHVIGYEFTTIMSWIFGSREYDPSRRTPFNKLGADLTIDKGVIRESQVQLEGPVIGADAEGTIRLIEQDIDYRARLRFSLSSLLRGLSLRIFGDWSKPSVAPDLGSVFSRTRSGEPGLVEALAGVDVTDPELATLIGRVLERAGPRGLDAATQNSLKALQQRAQGVR